ncbi:MAG: hypothetical protein ACSLFP_04365 [Acidimicrobiales bacterium]
MSVIDDDPQVTRDQKAGYSAMCRSESHLMCATAQTRCTCPCHGPNGQQTPTPKEPTMSEATVTPLPSKPVAVPDAPEHRCDECDFTSRTPQGIGRHRQAIHGVAGKAKPAKAAKAPAPARREPPADVLTAAPERVVLAIIAQAYADLNGADVATAIDSAADIIDALANAQLVVATLP